MIISGIVTITSVVLLFYFRSLKHSIVVDDFQTYGRFKKWTFLWDKEKFNQLGMINKSKYIINFVRGRLYGACTFGANTYYDHAFKLFLHIITCNLIFALFGFGHIGFGAALLYAVNPYNDQTTLWINGRRYQLAVIFGMMALIVAKPAGAIFYLISLSFQMTTFFLPVFVLDNAPLLFLLLPVIVLFAIPQIQSQYFERMKRIVNKDQKKWGIKRIIVVIKSYGFYFFRMVFPGVTMMNYPTLIEWGVTEQGNKDAYEINKDLLQGIMALICTGIIISHPPLKIIGIFIFLGILQWSAIVCAFQQLADRYMSMVNVFMMYVLVYFFHQIGYGAILTALFFGYYVSQLNVTMRMFRSLEDFFKYQLFWYPHLTRNSIIYADTFLAHQDITRAWMIIEQALRYNQKDFELNLRAAQCSACVGMIEKAEHFMAVAAENYYIGQEEFQKQKLANLRMQIEMIKKRMKKKT